jgi:hypothetical protein
MFGVLSMSVMSVKVCELNAMIARARNILITPAQQWVGVMGWRPGPGLNPHSRDM